MASNGSSRTRSTPLERALAASQQEPPPPPPNPSREAKRIAQTVRLRPSALQAYKDCHAAVWPAVLRQIKECNISDYSIFLDEQRMLLFASMKYSGEDFDADMEKMRANAEVRRWWEMTDSMQETLVPGSRGSTDPKGWWHGLEEVFRCE